MRSSTSQPTCCFPPLNTCSYSFVPAIHAACCPCHGLPSSLSPWERMHEGRWVASSDTNYRLAYPAAMIFLLFLWPILLGKGDSLCKFGGFGLLVIFFCSFPLYSLIFYFILGFASSFLFFPSISISCLPFSCSIFSIDWNDWIALRFVCSFDLLLLFSSSIFSFYLLCSIFFGGFASSCSVLQFSIFCLLLSSLIASSNWIAFWVQGFAFSFFFFFFFFVWCVIYLFSLVLLDA